MVTAAAFTVKVTVAEPPWALAIVAVQVPGFTGVTTSANVRPDPDGGANDTIALEPVPHDAALTVTVATATFVVTVTVCAYKPPTLENVIEEGDALSWPAGTGAAVLVLNGGAPPP